MIITEASQVSARGVGYPATPGIHSEEQVAGWKKVTNAVHNEGGRIFSQLWFCGRISHPDLLPDNQLPMAPSAIKPEGEAVTYQGMQAYVKPRALTIPEILEIVAQYRLAAELAKSAGFDGIEIHGANGYLIDQFLRDGTNHRNDEFGGSVEKRMRFLNKVLDAVCEVWPANRVGLRLTPENSFNSMSDSDPQRYFEYFIDQINTRGLAYLHVLEGDMLTNQKTVDYVALRQRYNGTYMANSGYDKQRANNALKNGEADLIAFGVPFLANPDLVLRFSKNAKLNDADQATFYGGDVKGYTDYSFLAAEEAAAV